MSFSTVTSVHGLPIIQFDDWVAPDAHGTIIRHGFFTRNGGVSTGHYDSLNCGFGSQDERANITENRRRVAASLGLTAQSLYGLRQYHSAISVFVKAGQDASLHPDADAHVTNIAGLGLAILIADCTPVLFADRQAGIIGAAHAGWRGACYGVLEATINMMCRHGASTENMTAVIGPCIRQQSYQVGKELRDVVLASPNSVASIASTDAYFIADDMPSKYRFDLAGYIVMRLGMAGLTSIHDCQCDTYSESDRFFSHRYATHIGDSDSGRLISIIALQPFTRNKQEA